MRSNVIMIMILLILSCVGFALAQKQEVKNNITYKVPTTGKIIDVDYWLEFQEWWIKCREGDGIAIYTYDKDNEAWGKVKFVPSPPDGASKDKKPASKEPAKQSDETDKETKTPEKKVGAQGEKDDAKSTGSEKSSGKEEKNKGASVGDTDKKGETQEQGRWWDPLNIIKKGKNLVAPDTEDDDRSLPPIEPSKPSE